MCWRSGISRAAAALASGLDLSKASLSCAFAWTNAGDAGACGLAHFNRHYSPFAACRCARLYSPQAASKSNVCICFCFAGQYGARPLPACCWTVGSGIGNGERYHARGRTQVHCASLLPLSDLWYKLDEGISVAKINGGRAVVALSKLRQKQRHQRKWRSGGGRKKDDVNRRLEREMAAAYENIRT